MKLKNRSYQPEILDSDHIPVEALYQNLKELELINTWLGGHIAIIKGVEKLKKKYSNLFQSLESSDLNQYLTIYEIGSGGGDNLYAIHQWAKKQNIHLNLVGIDLKEICINFAKKNYQHLNITWQISDYRKIDVSRQKPDIIFNSLFCHHFTDEQLVEMLKWMKDNSELGFFICDLHRHFIAYHSIKLLTKLFSKSYLVKNDAPLSVLRGFKKKEWQILLEKAGIHSYKIEWKWGFRYLIVVFK